jgi:hypothetical protein
MRVLVCGGRDYEDRAALFAVMDGLREEISAVITGGAGGADRLAHIWACRNDAKPEKYMAEWDRYGRAAGPIRNQRMIDEGKPDLVVAFPGGRGTSDMVRRATAAGIPVRAID